MKKFVLCLMTVALLLSMATLGVSADSPVKYEPDVTETDNGANGWYVGTNIDVELLEDGKFSLASIDGTAAAANVAWAFTYGQLKETPYLNLNIGNAAGAATTPYMKMYFTAGNATFTVAPFQDSSLQDWVKAAVVSGDNCVNLKEAVDDAAPSLTDDTFLYLFLYHDPLGTGEALLVDGLFLSDRVPAADGGNEGGNNTETGVESAVAVAAAAVIGAGALMLISRKK